MTVPASLAFPSPEGSINRAIVKTRAGKTIALLGILASMVMRSSPDELQLALIDVKNRLSIFDPSYYRGVLFQVTANTGTDFKACTAGSF